MELLTRLRGSAFAGKVLVLSAHQEDDWVFRAMQSGASGYVFKTHLAAQLCAAITTVLRDEIYLPPRWRPSSSGCSTTTRGAPCSRARAFT